MSEYLEENVEEIDEDDFLSRGPYDQIFKHRSIYYLRGVEEGIREAKIYAAKNLIGMMPIEEVARITELSKDEVLKIKETISEK